MNNSSLDSGSLSRPRPRIESIGALIPSEVVTSTDLVNQLAVDKKPPLEAVTGIVERRRAAPSDTSLDLALAAARDALEGSQYEAADIDLIISCSITRMVSVWRTQFAPSLAAVIGREIGASKDALTFDVANACAGMATGLFLADRMIKTGRATRALVVSGERITLITDTAVREIKDSYDPQFAALTVGDSGCALVVDGEGTEPDQIEAISLATASEAASLCVALPSDRSEGIAMYTDNKRMHSERRYTQAMEFVQHGLEGLGTTMADADYDYLIHHQFSLVALNYMRSIGEEKVFNGTMPTELNVMQFLGNTSSTALFLVLYHHIRNGTVEPGDRLLVVPTASGMVYGFISLRVGEAVA
ncbi:3-oxoacyl-ACP synthase III family protein [Tsukamurella strandjordii]|uniref:3-oxoacyl-ACP synthase III family protein n=1 Tax=Tsukamurella TaxID=2060 RepID=UPI001C7CD8EC|nr:3-oxoacyl-[acyl-carrier-protein] synthase III C-terminal domain-containing protein [Tsukamurella sp. TY48]GIZ99632.1 3-oxoacyl-ACP synthase [Tsukamurella sp. TY48]